MERETLDETLGRNGQSRLLSETLRRESEPNRGDGTSRAAQAGGAAPIRVSGTSTRLILPSHLPVSYNHFKTMTLK